MLRVFRHPAYLVLALFVTALVYLSIVWAPDASLIFAFTSQSTASPQLMLLIEHLLLSSLADSLASGALYPAAISLLAGTNVALLAFYFRFFRVAPSSVSVAAGVAGGIAALLGFGCAACGSLFLVSLSATVGGGLIAALPFHGEEFEFAGLFLLALSAYLLARAIDKPLVCPI